MDRVGVVGKGRENLCWSAQSIVTREKIFERCGGVSEKQAGNGDCMDPLS